MKKRTLKIGGSIAVAMLYASCCGAQSVTESNEPVTIEDTQASNPVLDLFSATFGRLLGMTNEAVIAAPEPDTTTPSADTQDYTIQTASIVPDTSTSVEGGNDLIVRPEELPICLDIDLPPAMLQTQSKYKQNDSSKSTVDEFAQAARDKTIQPIRNSVRQLTNIAYAPSDDPRVLEARAECVLHNVDRWAHARSLTEMRSADAYLSRDRWIAEVALAVQAAGKRVSISAERKALYASWFGAVAEDTIEAYSLRLGPKSRTNNHRYWAGLSVAAIGFLLDQPDYKSWGKTSFEIGACQVDDHGLLPAELARGEKALDYHVYALRPLAAIMKLAAESGESLDSKCLKGFQRLASRTRNALQNPTEFEKLAGLRQTMTYQENSYSAALKLDALPIYQ